MNESLRIGEIAGVRVGINWSVLVIFFLIAFGLAAGRFPAQFPDETTAAYVVAGLVAAVVFLGSLLAHEIAHALVAIRNGLEVDGITLWLFGGVARLGGEAADPGAEFRIAGVGPLVSIGLGGLFFLLTTAASGAGAPGLVVGVLGWLAVINVILAVFNLVPAAPLDGGRILRAYLWHRRGDRVGSAITASRAGRTFGFVLIALGLLEFVAGAGLGGLWLVLIGWFLVNAASAEEEHARMRGTLGDIRVGDVMSPDPVAVPGSLSVQEFIDRYLFHHHFTAFPLMEADGRAAGLVTLNRVKQVPWQERVTTTTGDIACPVDDIPLARPDEPLADLLPRMSAGADGRALVVEDGRVVGIVSPTDVARLLEVAELRSPQRTARM
ncbi:MAG TPA: site-2 protease family protein [Egibacteraceae bacterium]|nr:site-2 protease family protein [Egibacteraceae bacterium]